MSLRLRRITGEVARFSAVNVLATLVAVVVFNALVHGIRGWYHGPLHARPLTSYFLANTLGMLVSYSGSKRFAFRHRKAVGPGEGALNYVVINLASFVIPISCLWFSRNVLHYDDALSDNVAGNVVGAVLGTTFRFWAFRTFVFTSHGAHVLPPPEPGRVEGQHEAGRHLVSVGRDVGPEVGPHVAELVEHEPQQRDADADDVVRVAGDA
jgi:putative flippase GtrA